MTFLEDSIHKRSKSKFKSQPKDFENYKKSLRYVIFAMTERGR